MIVMGDDDYVEDGDDDILNQLFISHTEEGKKQTELDTVQIENVQASSVGTNAKLR